MTTRRPQASDGLAVPPSTTGSVDDTNTHTNGPDESDASAHETVWRAGYERVRTGPLRAQNDTAYNPEDESLEPVDDRPSRTTRGRPATDGAGLSTASRGEAATGSPPHP